MLFPYLTDYILITLIINIKNRSRTLPTSKAKRSPSKEKIIIFLTILFYVVLDSTIIDSRSIGDRMDQSRFPRKVSSDCRAVGRHRHDRPQLSSTMVIEPWRDNGDIRPTARRKYHRKCRRISSRNFSDATLPTTPLAGDSFRSLCLFLLRFISSDVRKPRASQVKFTDLLNSFRGKLEVRSFIGSHVCGSNFYRLHFHSSSFSK